jgi:hypothetical protein
MHPELSLRSREVYRRVYQRLAAAGLVHADGRNAAPSGIEAGTRGVGCEVRGRKSHTLVKILDPQLQTLEPKS